MSQLTWYRKTAGGNWDVADGWNDAADGSGTDRTNPQNGGGNTYICDLNAKAVSINVAVSVDQIRTGVTNAGGTIAIPNSTAATITVAVTNGVTSSYAGAMLTWGTGTCSLTINGPGTALNAVTYSSTSTSGMLPVGASQTLTVNTGMIRNTAAGTVIVQNSTGICVATNTGGTVVSASGGGKGINPNGSGALTTTGLATSAESSCAIYNYSSSVANAHNGNVQTTGSAGSGAYYLFGAGTLAWTPDATGTSASVASYYYAMNINNGTVNVLGNRLTTSKLSMTGTTGGPLFISTNGRLNYFGSFTQEANTECEITVAGGIVNLVKQTSPYTPLVLANSGTFVVNRMWGTLNTTGNGGASVASIVNQGDPTTDGGFAAILGGTAAQRSIITGPTLPAANKVDSAEADFGYAGDLQDPSLDLTTYTLKSGVVAAEFVISGHDNYTDGDAGTYHVCEVAEVLDSVAFGAGSLETGTYHAPEAAEVISTADFGPASGTPGTYDVADVAAGNIIAGKSIGGVAGEYPLTATTQAADAAILELQKDHLSSTETVTFGASSVVGTLNMALYTLITGVAAAGNVRKTVPRYTDGPDGTLVGCVDKNGNNQGASGILDADSDYESSGTLSAAGAYNSSGIIDTDGTFHAYGTFDAWAAFVATGIINAAGDHSDMTYAHTTAGGTLTIPIGADVQNGAIPYGIDGTSETPSYPTTAETEAAQLATDQAAVLAEAASIKDDAEILGQAGTYDFAAAIADAFADGQVDQFATDAAEVTVKADHLDDTETICAIAGTRDPDLYTLITEVANTLNTNADEMAVANDSLQSAYGCGAGTYDPMAAAVFPLAADVNVTDVAYGPTGAEYAGALDVAAAEAAAAAAQKVTDGAFLTTNKDEMIVANDSIVAEFGCDAGTAAGGDGGGPLVGPSALISG